MLHALDGSLSDQPAPSALHDVVERCTSVIQEVFDVTLTEAERDSLMEILGRAWTGQRHFLDELQEILSKAPPATPMPLDVKRRTLTAFGALSRLGDASEYSRWLAALLLRRHQQP